MSITAAEGSYLHRMLGEGALSGGLTPLPLVVLPELSGAAGVEESDGEGVAASPVGEEDAVEAATAAAVAAAEGDSADGSWDLNTNESTSVSGYPPNLLLSPPQDLPHSLLRRLDDEMYGEAVFDAVLVQRVAIFQDLPCEDQYQLILLGFEPPGNLLLELQSKKETVRREGVTA